jgi:hypothetical protein
MYHRLCELERRSRYGGLGSVFERLSDALGRLGVLALRVLSGIG